MGLLDHTAGEPFELLSRLGIGGFAVTYKARALEPELVEEFGSTIVALKVPHDRKKARSLKVEVEQLVALQHGIGRNNLDNLVRYLGFEVFQGGLVMIMEFVADGSLRDRIGCMDRQSPLPVEEALRISEGVLRGLEVIHHEHVLHRDIKPENILMQGETPKICDFGISRMLASDEFASTTTGTLHYMAPEILQAAGASFGADLWSLGVILYEMLTGRLPFGNARAPIGPLVTQICSAEPTPVEQLLPRIPRPVAEVVKRALRKDPQQRYGSAREMLAAVRAAQRAQHDPRVEAEAAQIRRHLAEGGDAGAGERAFRSLVERYPDDPGAYRWLGGFLNRCQRHAEAVECFGKGLALEPENALLHWNLALAYQQMGRVRPAVEALRRAEAGGLPADVERQARRLLKVLEAKRR